MTTAAYFTCTWKPEQISDKIILVGDPGRVALVASYFDEQGMLGIKPWIQHHNRYL